MLIPGQLLPYAFYLLAVSLLLYRIMWKEAANLYFLAAAAIAASALFVFEHAQLPLLISGIVIFNSIPFAAERKPGMLVILAGLAYVAFYISAGSSALLLAQAAFIGILAYPQHFAKQERKTDNRETERKRDIFHVAVGIVIVAAFILLNTAKAYYLLMLLILLGYLLRSFVLASNGNAVARYFLGLEREGAAFGSGAVWLALGSLLALSFISPVALLIPVLAAIFIADPLATIVGINMGGYKLPYNRHKTISGFLTYFAVVFAFAFVFAMQLSILIAIVAAAVESIQSRIDDNFGVPLFLAIILKFALL